MAIIRVEDISKFVSSFERKLFILIIGIHWRMIRHSHSYSPLFGWKSSSRFAKTVLSMIIWIIFTFKTSPQNMTPYLGGR